MINQKDHPELYAAKLRRLDRAIAELIADHHKKLKRLRSDHSLERIHQQAKERNRILRSISKEPDK